jgi:hypothetical protein
MNERIKELVKQAWEQRDLITATRALDDAFTDKFAELLVKDCIGIVESWAADNPELYGLSLEIMEHFNIELPDDNG